MAEAIVASGTLVQRIKASIASQSHDPDLTPGQIAATAGISTRYLHKLFEGEHETAPAARRRIGVVGLLVAVSVLASCGHPEADLSAPAAPSSTTLKLDCAPVAGGQGETWKVGTKAIEALHYPAAEGATGKAAQTAIVMSNQSNQSMCGWMPAVTVFQAYGAVWLFDYTVDNETGVADLTTVVAQAMAAGAERIVLVGASKGAKAALVMGAAMPEDVPTAVVALSPEPNLTDGTVVADEIDDTTFPALVVVAEDDPYVTVTSTKAMKDARPDATTQLLTVPGSLHGTALLSGDVAPQVIPAVQQFLTSQSSA